MTVAVEALIGAAIGFAVWLALYIAAVRHEAKERHDARGPELRVQETGNRLAAPPVPRVQS